MFREEGVFNYSTMLMRDDLGLLLLGAREAIYAVDVNDISVKKAAVRIAESGNSQRSHVVVERPHIFLVFKRLLHST